MSDRLEDILTTHLQDIKAGHDGKLELALQSYIDSKIIEARIDELDKIRLDGNLLRIKDWIITRRHHLKQTEVKDE